MKLISKIKSFLNKMLGKKETLSYHIVNLPEISKEEIAADNLSDMINNGSAIIGETDYLHAGADSVMTLYRILGNHNTNLMNIICVYVENNDLLYKYDMLAFQNENGENKVFFVLDEAWKMTPNNFNRVFTEQLTGFRWLYEDPDRDIFINKDTIIDITYKDILREMDNKEYAFFDIKKLQKYKDKESA